MCNSSNDQSHIFNHIEYLIAGNRHTEPEVLAVLAGSECPRVRAQVAENAATPLSTLAQLISDSSSEVRLALSYNFNLPKLFLDWLSRDKSVDLRYGMAENPNTPAHILQQLVLDANPYIATRANKTIVWIAQKAKQSSAPHTVAA